MDPITSSIITVLGKYVVDKGVELGQEVGQKAVGAVKEMLQLVLERIGKQKPETAAEFPQDPETYQKPMEKALAAEVSADQAFAAQLKELFAKYEEAAQEHATATGTVYRAVLKGSGAIAQGEGAVAAGAGGIAIGGSVEGGVHVGGQRTAEPQNDEVEQ